jgi:glycosyltransferase involved in cell wall biosynthesis
VVASAVDGCAEVLVDGVTGVLVPARDPAALGRALSRLLAEPALRAQLGEAAHRASRAYDIAQSVRNIENLYEEILTERKGSRAA